MASYRTLPFILKYSDKVDLINRLLTLYGAMSIHLTKRDIDLLTVCFLYDMNAKDFKDRVVSSNIGINNVQNVTTMFARLKKKGLVMNHPVKKRKIFNDDLLKIKETLDSYPNIAVQLLFNKGSEI